MIPNTRVFLETMEDTVVLGLGSAAVLMHPILTGKWFLSWPIKLLKQSFDPYSPLLLVVVVALLFYVHGKHLRSCRDGQLT